MKTMKIFLSRKNILNQIVPIKRVFLVFIFMKTVSVSAFAIVGKKQRSIVWVPQEKRHQLKEVQIMIDFDYEMEDSYETNDENTTSNSLIASMYTAMSSNMMTVGGTTVPFDRD